MSDLLCLKCGKRKRYERNGRVFNLCAVCAWNDLQELFYTEGDAMNCVICGEDCHGDYCRDCQIDVEIQECGSYFIGDEDEDDEDEEPTVLTHCPEGHGLLLFGFCDICKTQYSHSG